MTETLLRRLTHIARLGRTIATSSPKQRAGSDRPDSEDREGPLLWMVKDNKGSSRVL